MHYGVHSRPHCVGCTSAGPSAARRLHAADFASDRRDHSDASAAMRPTMHRPLVVHQNMRTTAIKNAKNPETTQSEHFKKIGKWIISRVLYLIVLSHSHERTVKTNFFKTGGGGPSANF